MQISKEIMEGNKKIKVGDLIKTHDGFLFMLIANDSRQFNLLRLIDGNKRKSDNFIFTTTIKTHDSIENAIRGLGEYEIIPSEDVELVFKNKENI